MKLPQLQSLLPGRGMMFVALGLSLAIGWYFYNASGVADHLTKRNFNYLNQIGSNIDASVDAAGQYGKFVSTKKIALDIYGEYNSQFSEGINKYLKQDEEKKTSLIPIRKPSPKAILEQAAYKVLEGMKLRLVRDGKLVSDPQNVSIEIVKETMKPRIANTAPQNPISNERAIETKEVDLAPRDVSLFVLPVNVCRGEECKGQKAACLTMTELDYAPVELASTGFKSTFSVLLGVPEVDYTNCRLKKERPKTYLRAKFSVTIPFADIQGVGNGETAFDTVLLAKSDGKPDGSPLIFSNVDAQSYSGDLLRLLNVSSRFERFSSIRELERSNRPGHDGTLLTEAPKKETNGAQRAFTQSSVIPFRIGGFSNLAFVQPFSSAQIPGKANLVLIGILAESTFNKSKYAVPYNWLSNALLLLLLGLLSLNFARLKLIKNKGILRRSDIYISIFSLAGVASLSVVFLFQLFASGEFGAFFDEDAREIHAKLSSQFENELDAKMERIKDIHNKKIPEMDCSKRSEGDSGDCYIKEKYSKHVMPKRGSLGACPQDGKQNQNVRVQSATSGFPEVTTQFLLNQSGVQHCYYFTHNLRLVPSRFNVESRDYFRKIRDGESWKTERISWSDELQRDRGGIFSGEFYLNRIESKTDGAQQTAISFPFGDSVLVALAKFYSLEHTVLPPGHGFSVFNNKSGLVLFHSSESRNLRENFYRATDDNEDLKSTVLTRSKREVSLIYKGELVDAIVSPLKNTQWTLVTFHRNSIVDAFNFHLGTSALMLGGVYGVIFLIALPGSILLLRWLCRMTISVRIEERFRLSELPQWIFPERGKSVTQRALAISLLQLVIAYIACIYFFDLPESRWWIMIVLIAVPCCWFYFLHMSPEREEKVPIGAPFLADKAQRIADEKSNEVVRAFGLYRINITLSIVLLAVLPTLLLSTENNDIHQKQWLQFSHWFNVEKLKQRSASYMQLSAKYRQDENLCSDAVICERAWRGILIPETNFNGVNPTISQPEPVEDGSDFSDAYDIANHSLLGWQSTLGVHRRDNNHKCAPYSAQIGDEEFASNSVGGRSQNGYLDSILSMLPSFGVEGELLEGLDGSTTCYDRDSSKWWIQSADPGSGLIYTSDLPERRPRDAAGIVLWVIFYLCMASFGAVISAALAGFLVRRFLSRSFEENILDITTIPIARDLIGGAILVRPSDVEMDEAYQAVLRILGLEADDFKVIAGAHTPENQVVVTEGSAKLVIVRDFFNVTQDHTTSSEALTLVRQRLREGYSLIMLSDIDPNHWAKRDQVTEEAFELWEGIINSLPTFMMPILGEARSLDNRQYVLSPRVYKRVWRRCSEDEQMVLAGLCHEGIVNPQNEFTLRSLYRRRLVNFQNSHFEFGDMDWREYVAESLNREDFRARARRYKNSVWISFRGPMILILLVLVMFIAYVAQDEMRLLFSLIASIGAGAGALSALGGRLSSMATKTASE